MDDRVRRSLGKIERLLRPKSVAAIRQAGEQARANDASERGNELLAELLAEVRDHAARLDRIEGLLRDQREDGPSNDRYDRQTDEVLSRVLRTTDTCIDVGAHEGLILERILHHAPEGRHHAFEPLPEMAKALRERFPGVEVHDVALAAQAGESSFHHVVTNPSYSGLRERRYDREGEQVELITVHTARLDDVLPPDLDVRVVKIDVEGGEEGVLRGGAATFARCRPYVVFEHGLGAADHYGTTPATVYELLTGFGLEVSLLERWLAGRPALSADEFIDEFESGRNYYFLAYPPS